MVMSSPYPMVPVCASFSWNVERLKKRVGAQAVADALLVHEPAVILLHDCRRNREGDRLTASLAEAGFVPCVHPASEFIFRTIAYTRPPASLARTPSPLAADDPFWIELRIGTLGISGAHIPLKNKKYAAWRAAHWQAGLSIAHSKDTGKHLLIGDLNTALHGIDEVECVVPGDHYLKELEEAGWLEGWRRLNPSEPEATVTVGTTPPREEDFGLIRHGCRQH
jgi:hypothetical protein